MDRENKLGTEWSPELMNALKRAASLSRSTLGVTLKATIAAGNGLPSPAARSSPGAGRRGASAIVPALWTRLDRDRIPRSRSPFSIDHADLGERYCAEGFYGIMKLQNYRADYQRAVHRLAERIIEIGDRSVAVHADDDVARSSSERISNRCRARSAPPAPGGPRTANCRSRCWRTTPRRCRPAGPATTTARSAHLEPVPARLSTAAGRLRAELAKKCLDCEPRSRRSRNDTPSSDDGRLTPPGLCLVDAWVTLSDAYRDRLRRLNQIKEPWVSVLIPWNSQDEGMSAAEEISAETASASAGRKLDSVPRRCRMAADGIPTLQDFGEVLPEMTMIMLKRFRKGAPARPPEGPVIGRPRLRQAGPEEFGASDE